MRAIVSSVASSLKQTLLLTLLAVTAAGCSSDSPTAPSPAPVTRIIALSGSLAFGDVPVGSESSLQFTVHNTGTGTLTVSGMSYTGVSGAASAYTYRSSTTVVSAGGAVPFTVFFRPTAAGSYNGTFTINADHTSGANTLLVFGAGMSAPATPAPAPSPTLYSINGTITDAPSRVALPNVTVEIESGTNAGRETRTDSNGRYTLSGLSGGSLTLSAGANSYYTSTRQVTLTGNAQIDFVLERTPPVSSGPPSSRTRIGATCNDGWISGATGSGACSSHGGVRCWRYSDGSCTNP